MDIHQITNIIAIEDEGNIARAAEKLYITQSALNQQLLKLEKELGIPLFQRQRHRMVPTPAGRVYLQKAREIVRIKEEAYRIIGDYANENSGEISIVYTPERGSRMFAEVFLKFREKYPKVRFHTHEARNIKMEQMLLRGEVTIACLSYTQATKNPKLSYYSSQEEPFVVACPTSRGYVQETLAAAADGERLPVIDLNALRDESFVLHTRETLSRAIEDEAFERAGFSPQVLFETSNSAISLQMARQQEAACIMQLGYAHGTEGVTCFRFAPFPLWSISVATLKNAYLTKPERYLVQLITEYNKTIFQSEE